MQLQFLLMVICYDCLGGGYIVSQPATVGSKHCRAIDVYVRTANSHLSVSDLLASAGGSFAHIAVVHRSQLDLCWCKKLMITVVFLYRFVAVSHPAQQFAVSELTLAPLMVQHVVL